MQPGFLRIIGGKWRGRKLKILSVNDLRPTPDRVRETLFNWLAWHIQDAYCLDLFTGSGALGFEALSRGAAYVEMVDHSIEVVKLIKEELLRFSAQHALIYQANIPSQLRPSQKPFNVVFIDPPYQAGVLLPTCFYLEEQGFLADSAYIYLEANEVIKDNDLPQNWHLLKCQRAGQVVYHLAKRERKSHDT